MLSPKNKAKGKGKDSDKGKGKGSEKGKDENRERTPAPTPTNRDERMTKVLLLREQVADFARTSELRLIMQKSPEVFSLFPCEPTA